MKIFAVVYDSGYRSHTVHVIDAVAWFGDEDHANNFAAGLDDQPATDWQIYTAADIKTGHAAPPTKVSLYSIRWNRNECMWEVENAPNRDVPPAQFKTEEPAKDCVKWCEEQASKFDVAGGPAAPQERQMPLVWRLDELERRVNNLERVNLSRAP